MQETAKASDYACFGAGLALTALTFAAAAGIAQPLPTHRVTESTDTFRGYCLQEQFAGQETRDPIVVQNLEIDQARMHNCIREHQAVSDLGAKGLAGLGVAALLGFPAGLAFWVSGGPVARSIGRKFDM